MTKEAAYIKIEELVTRFTDQIASYKKSDYNETQTRRDFIDPFFKALGWDVDNENGNAEAYREVIHEDRVKVGKATKAPDYSFRLSGGKRLFFVEAKKPSVFIKDEVLPAYQVRRYGWSAKLSISIITDFEEFAIYDCSKKPLPTDKAAVARIKYLNYKDYLNEFDFIWDTFSKEKVLKGSFDKFIQGTANKKGTSTVDKAFLETLDNCRTILAESIAKLNPALDEDEINFAVQQTIDRIIFLRIAEDRSIEPYGKLQESLKFGNYYTNLFGIFKIADDKYNSGLFNFKKDTISQNLQIDNKVLKTIINQFYYPECPYEFSVLSVEILGSAYEQFLGKTITINKNHKAVIELKPEVRKAGGVYYTPQYIVDYIVENTLGKLTQNKTPKQIAELKVVDPACGSGSFLIGAYQHLLNYHSTYYQQNPTVAKKDKALTPTGSLSTSIKKQILLNNIYGVDIDINAVEVTKLSLLLKCMEGETQASITNQASLFNERVLPTLDDNIKSGNSLIDTDFYDQQLDFGEEKKIKPFNWQKAFPSVFNRNIEIVKKINYREQFNKVQKLATDTDKLINDILNEPQAEYNKKYNGGFDVVLGNPPYLGGREWKEENGNAYNYFINKYKVAEYQFDIYALFLEAAINLVHSNGLVGYITPNTWLNNQSNKKLRTYILNKTTVTSIVDYSKIKVFDQATVLPIITVLQKGISDIETVVYEPSDSSLILTQTVNQNMWLDGNLNIININLSQSDLVLRDKIEENTQTLESFAMIKFGIKVYQTGKGRPKQTPEAATNKIFESKSKLTNEYLPYLKGRDINKYQYHWNGDWLHYGEHLAEPRNISLFQSQRILVRRIVGETLIAAFIDEDLVTGQLLQIVKPYSLEHTKTLLGIISSKLLAFYFKKKYNRQDKTFPEIRIYELASLPIKQFTSENKSIRMEIEKFVNQLLQLNKDLQTTTLETKKEQLKNKIDYCEDKTNKLVYQLYNLTEEEIKIVEGL